jgi:hypothetical protein
MGSLENVWNHNETILVLIWLNEGLLLKLISGQVRKIGSEGGYAKNKMQKNLF